MPVHPAARTQRDGGPFILSNGPAFNVQLESAHIKSQKE